MISIVIPAKNEQGNIGPLMKEIHQALDNVTPFEIVVVDDGSNDATYREILDTAAELGCAAQAIRHQHSAGQSTAVHTGVQHAQGRWIVTLDADGQNDPADIPALLAKANTLTANDFCIAGYRKQRKDTAWKRTQSRIANNIRQALLKDGVPDTGCGLKLFPRATFLRLPYFDHMHRYIPALIRRLDGEIHVQEVNHRDRTVGESKYNAWNRAWVGIVDMLGVMWLQQRSRAVNIEKADKAQHPDNVDRVDNAEEAA